MIRKVWDEFHSNIISPFASPFKPFFVMVESIKAWVAYECLGMEGAIGRTLDLLEA